MLPKKAWKNHGVSEVVGTILILLMTVVLFSTVIIWVNGFPAPKASNRLDMEAQVVPQYNAGVWNGAQIILTHRGGETMKPESTRIYRTVNGNTEVLQLSGKNFDGFGINSYGISGPDTTWNIGEAWTYVNHSIPQNAQIHIIIADIIRSSVLWEQDVYGVSGLEPPLFVDKWTDAIPSTPSRDPIQPGDTFNLYVGVVDPDGNLNRNSVYAKFTFLAGQPTYKMWDDGPLGGHGDGVAGDGVFTFQETTAAASGWDGGAIILNATDTKGLQTQSRFLLSVVTLGTTNIFNNGTATGPLNLTRLNGLQRYDFFNKTAWDAKSWSATPTQTFKQGETVVVVVASKYLVNLDLSDQFTVYDTTTGYQQVLVYGGGPMGASTHPSSTSAFTFNSVQAGYNIFIYQFSTKAGDYGFGGGQMAPGRYPVTLDLKSAYVPPPNNRFYANDQITVTSGSGSVPNYPSIMTYKDPAMTQPLAQFSFTQTMYVKVVVKDTDASFSIGTVQAQDYLGGIQVLAAPGSSPVSAAQINSTTTYKLSVDLSRPNLDNWLFGNNSYTLTLFNIVDGDENYNFLAMQVRVIGPRWVMDAAVGTLFQKHQTFGDTIYGRFYPNAVNWAPTELEFIPSVPGTKAPANPITALVFGDLDSNGYLDIAAGQDADKKLNGKDVQGVVEWFRNTNGLGYSSSGSSPWEKILIDTLCPNFTVSPCISTIAVGHIDKDRLQDIAVGTTLGEIWWYSNDGQWTPHFMANVGVAVNALKLADMNGDGIADIVVALQTNANSIRVYINDGTGVFGTSTQTINSGCCLMAADSGGIGTIGSDPVGLAAPYYRYTQTTNDQRETVQEVRANYSTPTGEVLGSLETVIGSYVNATTLDNQYETITEGASGTVYSLGTANGHRWNYTNIWASTTDTVEVHIHAGIQAPGTEAFQVRWSTSPTGPWTSLGTIDSGVLGEYVFSFKPTVAINKGTIYISILDVDQSAGDATVGGDGILTTIQIDQAYLVITRSSGTTSATSHIWTTQAITAGQDAYKFFIEGFHTSNNEGDDFIFRYATTLKGPYVDLLTVKSIDSDNTVSVSMDKSVGGKTLYVLVEDLDRGTGSTILDTVKIDYMYVNGYKASPIAYNLNPGAPTVSIAIADIDADKHPDIVAGISGTTVKVYYNNGDGRGYAVSDTLPTPANVNSVDVGYLSGAAGSLYPDGRFDIAVALANNKIQGFFYNGVRGSWSAATLFDLSTTEATKIRVGDIDGDYWDDMVVITSDFHIFEIHNKRGTGFEQFTIDNIGKFLYDVDIGATERGITASYVVS